MDSNSHHKTDDNNYFTEKGSKIARYMSLLIKAVAICAGKKAGYYC